MRYLISILTSLLLVSGSMVAQDKDGHVLVDLWAQYDQMFRADKPKDAEAILEIIIKEASAKKLSWDFYDANERYVSVRRRYNWKNYEQDRKDADRRLLDFNDPVALVYYYASRYNAEKVLAVTRERKEELINSCTPVFYKKDCSFTSVYLHEYIAEQIHNDYEFALWCCMPKECPERAEYYRNNYPLSQIDEYSRIMSLPVGQQAESLAINAKKYKGKAVSHLFYQSLTRKELGDLGLKGTSSQYRELEARLTALQRERKSFSGEEKKLSACLTGIDQMVEQLNRQNVFLNISKGKFEVYTNNLDEVKVSVYEGKTLKYSDKVVNTKRSFYVCDTLRMDIPDLDDGEYTVVCERGKIKSETTWRKYSISLATRWDNSGCAAYATDYMTGKPIPGYETGFVKFITSGDTYSVTYNDNGRIRKSGSVGIDFRSDMSPQDRTLVISAQPFTDRTAYRPGETLRFKAVLFRKRFDLAPVQAGLKVTARLHDPQGKAVAEKQLVTNEFGSVASEFVIERGERNGSYRLDFLLDDRVLTDIFVQVDDFVAPSFDVVFEDVDKVSPGDTVRFRGRVQSYSGHPMTDADVTYRVSGSCTMEGALELLPDGSFEISFPSNNSDRWQSWHLSVKVVDGTGEVRNFTKSANNYISTSATNEKKQMFKDVSDDDNIAIELNAGDGPLWAVAELFGINGQLLEHKMVYKSGVVSYPYKASYPESVSLNIVFFRDGKYYHNSVSRHRKDERYELPLSFTRFLDSTLPGAEYAFEIQTAPGVECVASIYDAALDKIRRNKWFVTRPSVYPAYRPAYGERTGQNETYMALRYNDRGPVMYKTSVAMAASNAVMDETVIEEEAIPFMLVGGRGSEHVREDFSQTVAWEPMLRSDKNGRIMLRFKNSDKLSTYHVQLYAHDKAMRNNMIVRDMMITIPVKVAVVEPQMLYVGDRYFAKVTVSNTLDVPVRGKVDINGKLIPVEIAARGTKACQTEVKVPVTGALELMVRFTADNPEYGGDAVKLAIPVRRAVQNITESHSALIQGGADKSAVIAMLRSQFVNVPGKNAQVRQISILDMLKEAIPQEFASRNKDVVSRIRSIYASAVARNLGMTGLTAEQEAKAITEIFSCRNSDGGFGWMPGMHSSPILTAVILDMCASLSERGLEVPAEIDVWLPDAVRYLDDRFFGDRDKVWWRGGLNLEQYLHVRSMYPGIRFEQKCDADFLKAAREYLVPKKERNLNGQVFAKARRILTLRNLMASGEALALAKKWGVTFGTHNRLEQSLEADVASLTQYAVEHKSGGVYYPNAVIPWRGLLESEVYAHSMLCRLMDDFGHADIAEGIRLWLMVQKETQEWKNDPGYVEALAAVMQASPKTLETEVIALTASAEMDFADIKSAGNGFGVERRFCLVDSKGKRTELKDGDKLQVGDKVIAEYRISNDENRSFVKIHAPRPACLRPERQLSGMGWGYYRSVGVDATDYWYDVYPEEKTVVSEAFYVTQAGRFHCAALTVESLYAPHYRANGTADYVMEAR